jgi:hypothetical protein
MSTERDLKPWYKERLGQELTHIRFWWLVGEEEVGSVDFDGEVEVAMAAMMQGHWWAGLFLSTGGQLPPPGGNC